MDPSPSRADASGASTDGETDQLILEERKRTYSAEYAARLGSPRHRENSFIRVAYDKTPPTTPENRKRIPLSSAGSSVSPCRLVNQVQRAQREWHKKGAKCQDLPDSDPPSPCSLIIHRRQHKDWKTRYRTILRKHNLASLPHWRLPSIKVSRDGPLRSKSAAIKRLRPKTEEWYFELSST
ncbi:hypothetical protein BDV59DRAFT_55253 [Aspergillus ambiguus]|uniref:uncharacterized protein n=1 Tax=Aspergillus ambiguus TaxID=176160 RepID=UPI003CCCF284